MQNLLSEFDYNLPSAPFKLCMDNNSAIAVAKNPEHHGRMKHLDLRFYWLRGEVEKGTFNVKYIPTDHMVADLLTKPLTKPKGVDSCIMLGLQ